MRIIFETIRSEVTFEINPDITLRELLEELETVIRARGYRLDGHLDIVEEETT